MHLNSFCSLNRGKSDGFGFAPSPRFGELGLG